MDHMILVQAAAAVGVVTTALPDAVARGLAAFADTEPDQAALDAWAMRLKTEAPHFFAVPPPGGRGAETVLPPGYERLSAIERLAWARAQGAVPKKERPKAVQLSSEEAARLAGLSVTQRLTEYRRLQEQRR